MVLHSALAVVLHSAVYKVLHSAVDIVLLARTLPLCSSHVYLYKSSGRILRPILCKHIPRRIIKPVSLNLECSYIMNFRPEINYCPVSGC